MIALRDGVRGLHLSPAAPRAPDHLRQARAMLTGRSLGGTTISPWPAGSLTKRHRHHHRTYSSGTSEADYFQ
jgi:hypothetical protein